MRTLVRPVRTAAQIGPQATGTTRMNPVASTIATVPEHAPVVSPVLAQGAPLQVAALTIPEILRDRKFTRDDLLRLLERAKGSQSHARVAAEIRAIKETREEVDKVENPDMDAAVLLKSAIEMACTIDVELAYVGQALDEMARQLSDAERAADVRRAFYEQYGVAISERTIADDIVTQLKTMMDDSHYIEYGNPHLSRLWFDSPCSISGTPYPSLRMKKKIKIENIVTKRVGFLWLNKVQVEEVQLKEKELFQFDFKEFLIDSKHAVAVHIHSADGVLVLERLMDWLTQKYPHVQVEFTRTFPEE